ncbi:fasciclin domain-containing protein [Oscillatoria sp. FACHB-1407]|uniref:fasciclin domain-containing protein n=1 Tax=Oscillatoria sp. FACHB-1407 TaxID=2692847 RepID=UPI0016885550|nr:fasciclin domain-containing protein [Oscillatoria sp. FACHB-1407]MBD2459494.1 fasciclin domain-containing protein [Oscillatoria sp. FACHB-1407]
MANLVETANSAGSFNTLMTALKAADLEATLSSPGPFTILAPTDEAFEQLPQGELDSLLQDPHKLKQVLLYHVISGDVRSDDLIEIDEAPTVEGTLVAVEQAEDGVRINDSRVLQMDILAENGVIHVIDGVLMPVIMG